MRKILLLLINILLLSSVSFADTTISIIDTQTSYSELELQYIYHDYTTEDGVFIEGVKLFDNVRNISVIFYFNGDFGQIKEYYNSRYFYDYTNDDLIILYVE